MQTYSEQDLIDILLSSKPIKEILDNAYKLDLPNWYLAGGSISQTVWNHLTGQQLESNINDYDLGYFDDKDLSPNSEKIIQERTKDLFPKINVEIMNQARVHLWYKEYFGIEAQPYKSAENVIETLPFTVSCVGLRKLKDKYHVYSPFGLEDIFTMTLRINTNAVVPKDLLKTKFEKWQRYWVDIKIANTLQS